MITTRRLALLCCSLCTFLTVPIQGRLADKKCQEYIDLNSESSIGGTLSLTPDVVEIKAANCSTSVDLIVNGVEALIGEFPHQALLAKPRENDSSVMEYYCGGSLISEQFVLTAAHCHRPTIVRLGEHNLTDQDFDTVDFEVSDYYRHPKFTLKQSYFDIALVLLASYVDFVPAIRPACLWTSDPLNYSSVVATGFGATEIGPNSTVLMKVRLNVMDNQRCDDKFYGNRKLTDGVNDNQMCVGSQEGGRDTCNGDSGGPIQVATDLNTCAYYVVGITSLGGVCGIGTSESLYTKVVSFLDWIEQMVWPLEWEEYQYSDMEQLRSDNWLNKEAVDPQTTVKSMFSNAELNSYRIYFPDD